MFLEDMREDNPMGKHARKIQGKSRSKGELVARVKAKFFSLRYTFQPLFCVDTVYHQLVVEVVAPSSSFVLFPEAKGDFCIT